eukprot:Skav224967  [mRNA]  locus=scaffold3807:14062:14604:+ [translate_table: standard]
MFAYLAKVFAHALFYCTGVGVTILLMNLLVGVLGSNYERYEDRSVILFQRARAKMLLEMQHRPWKHLLGCMLRFRFGRFVFLIGGIMVLLLLSPLFFSVSTCLILILLFLRIVFQMQLSGIYYSLEVALGYLGEGCTETAEECRIWVVKREDASMDETRSLRSAMKAEMAETVTKLAGCF